MKIRRNYTGCTVGILGDSYSTFTGYIPAHQESYYPKPEKVPDVSGVEHTWWMQLTNRMDMRVLVNDSYSGSTVCCDVRDGQPPESAFVVRMEKSLSPEGIEGELPDVIFLFGATNDSWLCREIGRVQFEGWTPQDLRRVLPAYCYLIDYTVRSNPQALVVCILNDLLNPQIHEGMRAACAHYGVLCAELKGIDKKFDHPTRLGMAQIAEQVERLLKEA